MDSNIIELVKLGHERADELKASCGAVDVRSVAQLISDLASQLEVQLVCSNALAAELKKSQIDANCYKKGMEASNARLVQLAAENAYLMQRIDWPKQQCPTTGDVTDVEPADFIPSTDAFLAEVRAQGVEMLASLAGNECQRYKSVNDRSGARKWKSIVILCTDFAAKIRKGVQS